MLVKVLVEIEIIMQSTSASSPAEKIDETTGSEFFRNSNPKEPRMEPGQPSTKRVQKAGSFEIGAAFFESIPPRDANKGWTKLPHWNRWFS